MKPSPCKLYTMTMVYRREDGYVLALDRRKNDWPGLTFPGGHVEVGESIVDCAIREIKEETGLLIHHPVPCGIVHWADAVSGLRYLEFLYKTCEFEGELLRGTEEGTVFFTDPKNLCASDKLSPNFKEYLPLFLNGGYSELYYEWDGKSFAGVPQYRRFR